jgi:hypothetical protein
VTKLRRIALAAVTASLLALPALALAAKPHTGTYRGTVAAGYGSPQIEFGARRSRIQHLVARMLISCNGGAPELSVARPSKKFKISRKGSFSSRSVDRVPHVETDTTVIKGHFTSQRRATGTIRFSTTGGGETCDTQARRFTVTLRH